jgi:hypothetical protein
MPELALAAHHGPGCIRRDRAADPRAALDLMEQHGRVDALERPLAEALRDEDAAAERERRIAHDDAARVRDAFDPRREVRGRAEDQRLVADPVRVDDDEAGVDADADPIRRSSGRSPSTRWISSPARIARPASSSCACGQPK